MTRGTAGAATLADGLTQSQPPQAFLDAGAPAGDNVFDVSDFGATADPGFDNRPMIQAAIQAAHDAGGGIVYIPPGTYGIAADPEGPGAIKVLSNVFLKGAGMGETVLRLVDGSDGDVTGLIRSPWGEATTNWGASDLTIDGNQQNTTGNVDGFYSGPVPGGTIADQDVYLQRIEIHDVSRYGFDPHERTERLTIEDSVAHHNGVDGFVLDMVVGGTITGNSSYENGRHGFNVVTSSQDLLLANNVAHDNGGTGLAIQRGSENIESPGNIVVQGGSYYANGREGILVQMSDDVVISGAEIYQNGMSGIRLYGASHVTVEDNLISNNSQNQHDAYSEVGIASYDDASFGQVYEAAYNLIQGNTISSSGEVRSRYGIEERAGATSNNEVAGNDISGTVRGPIALSGEGSYALYPGSDGNDTITGSATQDHLTGGDGDDLLKGKDGNDLIEGGLGNDELIGGKGADVLLGGGGADVLNGNSGDDFLAGGGGDDWLSGTSGDDTLDGGAGNDSLYGGSGADTFIASAGNNFYSGGSGFDTLDFSLATAAVSINASKKTATGFGDDQFKSIASFTGSAYADTFRGSDGANIFDGGDGDDAIRGAGGADTFTGGAGADSYHWLQRDVISSTGHRGVDVITDYSAEDHLDFAALLKGQSYALIDDVVHISDTAQGALVSVLLDGSFEDVVLLEGVHENDGSGWSIADTILV